MTFRQREWLLMDEKQLIKEYAHHLCYRTLMGAADTETPEDRPKCGYDVAPSDQPYKPCSSEQGINRVIWSDGAIYRTGEDLVCDKHKGQVWERSNVEGIEPLDRTTK